MVVTTDRKTGREEYAMEAPAKLDLFDPDSYRAGPPHDYLRRLRREAPVCWHDAPGPDVRSISKLESSYWVLTRYADVIEVSKNPRLLSSQLSTCFLMDPAPEALHGLQAQLSILDQTGT